MAQRRSISDIGVRFVSDEIKRDHRDLEILYKVIVQAVDEGDDAAATGFKEQFCWELAGHLVAMQLLIFPGTNSRADAGNSVALRRRGNLALVSAPQRESVCETGGGEGAGGGGGGGGGGIRLPTYVGVPSSGGWRRGAFLVAMLGLARLTRPH